MYNYNTDFWGWFGFIIDLLDELVIDYKMLEY